MECADESTELWRHPLGSGCGTVDRVVTTNTKELGFESSHCQYLETIYLLLNCTEEYIKETEACLGPI